MERALFIERRDIKDLGDLLHVARSVGRKVFNVERVLIKPQVTLTDNGFILLVSPEHNGEKSLVERKNKNESEPKKQS